MTRARELAELAAAYDSGGLSNMKNRIINGNMVIDQRNAGAPVTSSGSFAVDRFTTINTTDGAFSAQQDSSAPSGFNKSLKLTVTTADSSLTTNQLLCHIQRIEGFNISDLDWGIASAKTVTLSFWVNSSVTGTFGGSLRNATPNRSYAFSYTINSANTWEYKTITIVGDTTGTWATNNSSGIQVGFCLGGGPDRLTTAGSWGSDGNILGPTGQTNLAATLNATFYITGVQLEKGSTATSFDYRPYTTELQLCQRYLPAWNTSAVNGPFAIGQAVSATQVNVMLPFQVQPRVPPTGITASAAGSFYLVNSSNGLAGTYSSTSFAYASLSTLHISCVTSAGLVAGNATYLGTNTPPAQILATGCEL